RATPSTLSRAPDGTLTALIARDGALYAARLDLGESGRGLTDVHRVATETDALSRWQRRDNRAHTFITTGAGSIDELVVHPDGTSAQIPRAQLDLPDGHFLIGVFPDHQDPEVFYAVLQRGFRGVD